MSIVSFNVHVVKTLKLVFYFSQDGVPLKLNNKAKQFYNLLERIVRVYFRPLFKCRRKVPLKNSSGSLSENTLVLT
jgi:hypothetical protein